MHFGVVSASCASLDYGNLVCAALGAGLRAVGRVCKYVHLYNSGQPIKIQDSKTLVSITKPKTTLQNEREKRKL